jgi:Periplasmic protease
LSENTGLALTTAKYYTPSGRLIQREYEGVSLFDYYNHLENEDKNPNHETKTTDSGRQVTGGGGITPDVKVAEPKEQSLPGRAAQQIRVLQLRAEIRTAAQGHPRLPDR